MVQYNPCRIFDEIPRQISCLVLGDSVILVQVSSATMVAVDVHTSTVGLIILCLVDFDYFQKYTANEN